MLTSATIFRVAQDFQLPPIDQLEEALQSHRFLHCELTQSEAEGWIAPRGNKSDVLAELIGGQLILRLCIERRVVPASAVRDAVDIRIERYKQETGRERVGAKIKKEFKEEAVFELLPRAFPKRSATTLWLDPVNHFLIVDTASLAGADRIVSRLVDSLAEIAGGPGIKVRPLQTSMSPAAAMSHWLASREAPYNFTVDRDCSLKMPDDQKSAVAYSRHTLEIDEVAQHIAAGKVPTQLALTWNDRVSFVLTDTGNLKKVKLLDVVLDGQGDTSASEDGFDADAAIATSELSALLPDLIDAFGGELSEGTTP